MPNFSFVFWTYLNLEGVQFSMALSYTLTVSHSSSIMPLYRTVEAAAIPWSRNFILVSNVRLSSVIHALLAFRELIKGFTAEIQ